MQGQRPGDALPDWKVVARNDATESNNQIHDDRVAQQYGFAGGLVPGITVYSPPAGATGR